MANLVTIQIESPPDTVDIDVAFYDKTEQDSLQKSELSDIFKDLPRRIAVPTPDFCTFYLYYKLRPGVPGFGSHAEVAKKWHQALVEFDGQVGFGKESIHSLSLKDNSTGTIERLGEAVGLSVASNLHGLHQADWARIPKGNTKTADFRRNIASDSVHIIEVENKGSIAAEIALKSSSISNHKDSIREKKKTLRANGDSRTVMYGTIAVLDNQPGSVTRCLLVDPPPTFFADARQFKILARLEYIAELISVLSPRSAFAASLQTRLAALASLRDISLLDRISLRRGSGSEYEAMEYSWRAGKTIVKGESAVGQINLVRPDMFFFIGIREELVEYAARQDFSKIEQYRFESKLKESTLECVVTSRRFKSEFATVLTIPKVAKEKQEGYVRFDLPALLHFTQSGLVFGAVAVPDAWRKTSTP